MSEEMETLTTMNPPLPTLAEGGRWRDRFAPVFASIEAQRAERIEADKRVEEAAERGARAAVASGDDGLIDAAEVALILGVTEDRVWALTRDGELPAVKLGRRTYRYRRGSVREAIARLES